MTEIEYLWDHWKFNADQRIKAFNFFVVLSVFANGGLFSALEKCVHSSVILVIGLFIATLAVVFWMLDARSRTLLHLSVEGIKAFEQSALQPNSRLFHKDEQNTKGLVRYTIAFRVLFICQLLVALVVGSYALASWPGGAVIPAYLPALSPCKP